MYEQKENPIRNKSSAELNPDARGRDATVQRAVLVDNRPQPRALSLLLKGAQTKSALQRRITMKDSGDARRSSGSENELRGEVRATIDNDEYNDLSLTRNQLRQSISARRSVENRDDGHEHRLQVELELLGSIDRALIPHNRRRARQRARKRVEQERKQREERQAHHLRTRYGNFSVLALDDSDEDSSESIETTSNIPSTTSKKKKKKKKKKAPALMDTSSKKRPPKDDPDDNGGGGFFGFFSGLKRMLFG